MSAMHTPGPWQVVTTEHPHHLGGKHVERRIFTTWAHPQLKGPMPVVNGSVGISAEKGGKPVHMVQIEEGDANLIAAAPNLLKAARMAREALAVALCVASPDLFETEADIAEHLVVKELDAAIAEATGRTA